MVYVVHIYITLYNIHVPDEFAPDTYPPGVTMCLTQSMFGYATLFTKRNYNNTTTLYVVTLCKRCAPRE